jgi:ribonucleotide reductase alpha subunit
MAAAERRRQGTRHAQCLSDGNCTDQFNFHPDRHDCRTGSGHEPFLLRRKKGAILPRVAPELSPATYWFYKNAHTIDQTWSVKAAGIRQRHVDQAQSFNLWITNDYKMSQLLHLYVLAWQSGVKTIYYVRSKALDPEDCESCSA